MVKVCKQKISGFTLVELLAVITILSIILLIAIPILMGVINNSKEKTTEQSVALYGRAVDNAIATYYVKYPEANEVTMQQLQEENMIEYKGKKVDCEIIQIVNRNVYLSNCSVDNKKVNYSYGENFGKLLDDLDNNGEISVGDKYEYKVNDTKKYNFYVLGIEGNNVNLIMDRNICEDGTTNYTAGNNYCRYGWYNNEIDNSYGPVTAMSALYEATKDWEYVSKMNLTYDDTTDNGDSGVKQSDLKYGYTGITVENGIAVITDKNTNNTVTIGTENDPLRARLPKLKEVTDRGCKLVSSNETYEGSCPWWLVNNLKKYSENYYDNTNIEYNDYSTESYWLLASSINVTDSARGVFKNGHINNGETKIDSSNNFSGAGIRPVITVPKDRLS